MALADGSGLAINTYPDLWRLDAELRERYLWDRSFAPVCVCRPETQGQPGQNPVVARSFPELLERLLDSDGQPFWRRPGFTGYGDAELYTRRL